MADLGVSRKRGKVTPLGGGRGVLGGASGFKASTVGLRVQVATLPNKRVQRTRSSASAPHSPLTRSPLGGRKLMMGLITLSVSCISVDGRLVPAWRSGVSNARCVSADALGGAAHLRVVVRDSRGFVANTSRVAVFRPDDPTALRLSLYLDADGTSETAMPLGPWVVEAALPSEKPVHARVELKAGQTCTVTVFLISHAPEVVVA